MSSCVEPEVRCEADVRTYAYIDIQNRHPKRCFIQGNEARPSLDAASDCQRDLLRERTPISHAEFVQKEGNRVL